MTPYSSSDTVFISGASSGIGKALAIRLAEKGCKLALVSRRQSLLEETAHQVRALGGEALVLPADLTDSQALQKTIQTTLATWGKVDYLFCNAGQYLRSSILDLSIQTLQQSMQINFYSHVQVILEVLPSMLERKKGYIVLIASMDAKKGIPPDSPYVAAKCALAGFGDTLRQELYGSGIQVTTVFPGRVDTPMIQNLKVPWISAKISADTCAKVILKGVQQKKAELILPAQAFLLYYLQVFSPRLADFAVRLFRLAGQEF